MIIVLRLVLWIDLRTVLIQIVVGSAKGLLVPISMIEGRNAVPASKKRR
jgi:hypothetical protein